MFQHRCDAIANMTIREEKEIREALRKHGPSSLDSLNYNSLAVILFSDCEVVRQALLERYRVQGTAAPLKLARKLRKYLTTGIAC
jgi:hypothetical protein